MNDECELTILMPCLNEEKTLEACIKKAQKYLCDSHINGEILVSDNDSSDNSQKIALKNQVNLTVIHEKGYGSALMHGIKCANGKFVIMGDADNSYDFYNLGGFIDKLRAGYDLVMGNRFQGDIEKGAMPFVNRYIGNPVLSYIGSRIYKCSVGDFHCGLRGFNKKAILNLDLKSTGMEFASEMIIKAHIKGLKITEIPIKLYKDGRGGKPHLNPIRDGVRHLKVLNEYKKF